MATTWALSSAVGKFLARTLARYPFPTQRQSRKAKRPSPPPALAPDHHPAEGHHMVQHGPRWRCLRCFRSSATKRLAVSECVDVRQHRIWRVGPFLFCCRCGAYSCLSARGLTKDCPGWAPRGSIALSRLARLWEGLHPVHKTRVAAQRPTEFSDWAWDSCFGGLHVVSDDSCVPCELA